ncbi:MAG: DUF1828 domain-containing protein [Actinobacteria bacterium]|nr:DUF1828 domain-containing protein [Actinomycetota bacterium]
MTEYARVDTAELLAFGAGDPRVVDRLREPTAIVGELPFAYPSGGRIEVFVTSDGSKVRFSEGGRLLRFLEKQGMDLAVDAVLSKTVFHALKDVRGAAAGSGEILLDCTPEDAPAAFWRFVQIVIEIVGLRHSKYKDALVRLARAENQADSSWDRP